MDVPVRKMCNFCLQNLFNFFLGSMKEAFEHCRSVEKTGAFNDTIEWLECAVDIFDQYQQKYGNYSLFS